MRVYQTYLANLCTAVSTAANAMSTRYVAQIASGSRILPKAKVRFLLSQEARNLSTIHHTSSGRRRSHCFLRLEMICSSRASSTGRSCCTNSCRKSARIVPLPLVTRTRKKRLKARRKSFPASRKEARSETADTQVAALCSDSCVGLVSKFVSTLQARRLNVFRPIGAQHSWSGQGKHKCPEL